jgi:hypothetical protein
MACGELHRMRQKLDLLGCVNLLRLTEPSSKSWLVQLSPKIQSIIYPLDCILVTIKKNDLCMYLLIVTLPLLGSCVAGAFGRFLGLRGTAIVTTTCVSLSFILSLIVFYEVALGASACYIKIAPWIFSEMFDASWGFFGDREVTG